MKKDTRRPPQKQRSFTCRWALPRDTADLLPPDHPECSNIGLRVDKLISVEIEKKPLSPLSEEKKRLKIEPIPLLAASAEYKETLRSYKKRWLSVLDALATTTFFVEKFRAKVMWRLVVGLGASSVRETSITLHRVHGFPIIPGSALKGLARAYASLVLGKGADDPEFALAFGTQQYRGKVVFFDAIPDIPKNDGLIPQLDVMTPHYSEYYRSERPPADYLQPVPISFYVVENAEFLFSLGGEDKSLVEKAAGWLKEALREMGVGAKSSAGYGYFEIQ